jgi:hypothetical protein
MARSTKAKAPAKTAPVKKPAASKKAAPAPAASKKAAAAPAAAKKAAAAAPAPSAAAAAAAGGEADVLIVSNKVCQAFKTRAEGLRKAVLAGKPSARVTIDEQKALGRNPDKGTFSVTVKGTTLKACVAMPRPFTAMKALDMDALAKEVIALL